MSRVLARPTGERAESRICIIKNIIYYEKKKTKTKTSGARNIACESSYFVDLVEVFFFFQINNDYLLACALQRRYDEISRTIRRGAVVRIVNV